MFEDENLKTIAEFSEDDLLAEMRKHSDFREAALEEVNFYELGEQEPLYFEKHVSYTLNQEG
jgi:hypothetical protein